MSKTGDSEVQKPVKKVKGSINTADYKKMPDDYPKAFKEKVMLGRDLEKVVGEFDYTVTQEETREIAKKVEQQARESANYIKEKVKNPLTQQLLIRNSINFFLRYYAAELVFKKNGLEQLFPQTRKEIVAPTEIINLQSTHKDKGAERK